MDIKNMFGFGAKTTEDEKVKNFLSAIRDTETDPDAVYATTLEELRRDPALIARAGIVNGMAPEKIDEALLRAAGYL